MGEGGDSNISVTWPILFLGAVLRGCGVSLSQGVPVPLTYLHLHQALPTRLQPLLQSLNPCYTGESQRQTQDPVSKCLSDIKTQQEDQEFKVISSSSKDVTIPHIFVFLSSSPPQAW